MKPTKQSVCQIFDREIRYTVPHWYVHRLPIDKEEALEPWSQSSCAAEAPNL